MKNLHETKYLKKAARYCAAILYLKHNAPERLKNVPQEDIDRAEVHAEEWAHMYIDGPDVGASWDPFHWDD